MYLYFNLIILHLVFSVDFSLVTLPIIKYKLHGLINKAKKGIIDVIFTNIPYELPSNFDSIKMISLHDSLACNSTFKYLKGKKPNKKI